MPVSPLLTPATRVTISNVPPFIPDELFTKELGWFGRLAGEVRPIPLGCKNDALKHILSFRRQVLMFLNSANKTLEASFRVSYGNSSYMLYASTDSLRCFRCGSVRHKRFECPLNQRGSAQEAQASVVAEHSRAPEGGAAGAVPEEPMEGTHPTPAPGAGHGQEVSERLMDTALDTEGGQQQTDLSVEEAGIQVGSRSGAQVSREPGAQWGSGSGARVGGESGARVGGESGAQVGSGSGAQVGGESGAHGGSENALCSEASGVQDQESEVLSESQLSVAVSLEGSEEDVESDDFSQPALWTSSVLGTLLDDLLQLDGQHRQDLDAALSFDEVTKAVYQLTSGRAPGVDGLPIDFYKAFWGIIGRDFFDVFLTSFGASVLPKSCQCAVLSLLPKKGDLCLLKNWRPVSLLCADYKILSRYIANRLKVVLGLIINDDQSYCVPARSIYDNLFLIRDLFDFAKSTGSEFGLLSLDQEKAFDRVDHTYLFAALKAFGFGDGFISWIRLLYTGASCLIRVRGVLSLPVLVSRGIRQGCPLSGQLYSIAAEPLLCLLRKRLSGLQTGASLVQVSAYADDLTVVIRGEQDVESLKEALHVYSRATSAKLNWAKTEALWCGSQSTGHMLPLLPGGVQWSRTGLKVLGVWLGTDEVKERNWEGVVEKEGGQGLLDVRSRVAVLRLQAVQRLLYSERHKWMDVACALLRAAGRLGLDRHLFTLRLAGVDLGGLTPFYLAAVEAWQLFLSSKVAGAAPSTWVFDEPLFFNPAFPSLDWISGTLRVSLLERGISKIRHLQRGVAWVAAEQLAEMAGLSEQLVFPELVLDVDLENWQEGQGKLLTSRTLTLGHFSSLSKRALYQACVKVLNVHTLRDMAPDLPLLLQGPGSSKLDLVAKMKTDV
ncbi:hypothetical protein NFI96_003951 [Prochilodus magdalenae]|nr:hypothetical protein NFI96_003951 [Prochilodus magdalenae]